MTLFAGAPVASVSRSMPSPLSFRSIFAGSAPRSDLQDRPIRSCLPAAAARARVASVTMASGGPQQAPGLTVSIPHHPPFMIASLGAYTWSHDVDPHEIAVRAPKTLSCSYLPATAEYVYLLPPSSESPSRSCVATQGESNLS